MTFPAQKRFHAPHMASILTLHVYVLAGGTLKPFIQCQAQGVPSTPPPPPSLHPHPGKPHHTDSPTPSQGEQTQTFSVLPPIPPQHHTRQHQHPKVGLRFMLRYTILSSERKASSDSTNKDTFCCELQQTNSFLYLCGVSYFSGGRANLRAACNPSFPGAITA